MRPRQPFADQKAAFAHFPVAVLFLRAAAEGDDRAFGQPLQIETHIEMILVQGPVQLFQIGQRFQPLLIDIHDVVDIRFARQNGGKLLVHSPDDARVGAVFPQGVQRRQGVQHVAERTHFDDEDILIWFHGISLLLRSFGQNRAENRLQINTTARRPVRRTPRREAYRRS